MRPNVVHIMILLLCSIPSWSASEQVVQQPLSLSSSLEFEKNNDTKRLTKAYGSLGSPAIFTKASQNFFLFFYFFYKFLFYLSKPQGTKVL